jgi:hypothetical protein
MDRYNIALGKEIPPPEQEQQNAAEISGIERNVSDALLGGLVTITDSHGNRFEGYVQECSLSTDRPVSRMLSTEGRPVEFISGHQTTMLQMDILINKYTIAPARPRPTRPRPTPTPPAPTKRSSGGQSVTY